MPPKGAAASRGRARKSSDAVARKVSTSSPNLARKEGKEANAMPPPPQPDGILEPEVDALSTCLKNAAVKTGQIYRFYADANKLNIQTHAPRPPQSLVASLGREVEKYDQLCDAIETQLLRAIAVLQRDLTREEERIARETAASPAVSPLPARVPLPARSPPTDTSALPNLTTPTASPVVAPLPLKGRRGSTISISSLQRNPFPHKLDLSSASFRVPTDDAASASLVPSSALFETGLPSPITLAPRSAQPGVEAFEFISQLSAAAPHMEMNAAPHHIDTIDLTLDDSPVLPKNTLGTADKPIELDMDIDMVNLGNTDADMENLGDMDDTDGLFTPRLEGDHKSDAKAPAGDVPPDGILDVLDVDSHLFSAEPKPAPAEASNAAAPLPQSLLASLAANHPELNFNGSSTAGSFNGINHDGLFANESHPESFNGTAANQFSGGNSTGGFDASMMDFLDIDMSDIGIPGLGPDNASGAPADPAPSANVQGMDMDDILNLGGNTNSASRGNKTTDGAKS